MNGFRTTAGVVVVVPSDLQVEINQSVKEGDSVTLTCKSSCSLPEQTTFICRSDAGNYQCAVSGYEHLKSPPVYLKDWGVNYSPSYVCALKGSTVKMSCTVKYPRDHQLLTVFWTKPVVDDTEYPDLCSDPVNNKRVKCVSEGKDTRSITLTSVTEADKHIYYCRFTTKTKGGKWTGVPGAQLDVTGKTNEHRNTQTHIIMSPVIPGAQTVEHDTSNAKVETQQSVKEGDSVTLTCKSSCSLPKQTTFICRSDEGNYQCAVSGYEHLKSPPVYLKVGWVDGLRDWGVNYSPSYVCAIKGSSVTMSCTSTSTGYHKLTRAFWTKIAVTNGEPPNLCSDPDKRGGIHLACRHRLDSNSGLHEHSSSSYVRSDASTSVPQKHQAVCCVTAVETQQSVKEGDSVTLTCKSSCSLPEQATFICQSFMMQETIDVLFQDMNI
ncbi:hypothetical protein M9458_056547 [Cirrhinus mrigala]|uniref:Ig-like domain-containing protein n=1 Tax=Cirrhinus mrigala TaxID=683832 RepID=A0ABD0MD04_CIRMR